MSDSYSDVFYYSDPVPSLAYRSSLAVYEEALIHGRLVGRCWNGAGYPSPWEDVRLDPLKHAAPQSFWLEVGGQLLASHWEWVDFEKKQEGHAIDAMGLHSILTLRHSVRPLTVQVHMLLDGTPVFTRWLTITNTGSQPAALGSCAPWSGVLLTTPRWRLHLPDKTAPLYHLGYFEDTHWGDEGNFQWHALPNAGYQVFGRYRRDRHRHPFFVLRNNATGEFFTGLLAWSGGYRFDFDLDADLGNGDGCARLFFRGGPDAPAPQRVIAPGETINTPEMHLGLTFGDLDSAVQAMHTHLRRSVFLPQPRGRGGWVEMGIGPEVEITTDYVYHMIESAARLGSEVFFIDASWYAAPRSDWWSTVGDWQVDLQRFPGGLEPFRKLVHEKGMLWGLWMDAERIAPKSQIVQEHPEWLGKPYDEHSRLGDVLDLTNPEAAHWMEEQIARVISENKLEFFRLDYNTGGIGSGAQVARQGYVESSYWRYYEVLYAIYERLRARFPDVIFENCAGGGGRSDLGMVRRFSHTWVTDWQIAPRSFTITNGMTMALPPETVDRLLAGQNGHTTAEIDFQWRLLLFVRPTLNVFAPLGAGFNPLLMDRVVHFVNLYKEFVRPFQTASRIYHHTPEFSGPEPQGWGVLELASEDRQRGIAGLFQLSAPVKPEYVFQARGLDAGKRYRVTFDNTGQVCEVDGFTLMKQGLTVRLEGALTSELLVFEAL